MLFNSFSFLVFFPFAVLLYYIIPHKTQSLYLAFINYLFYMCWSPRYALILLVMTGMTYFLGIVIDRCSGQKRADYLLIVGIVFILSVLCFYKYGNFILRNVRSFLQNVSLYTTQNNFVDVIAPIGISFYSFQMITYLADLYRREVPVEKNFIRYALFISFFPTLCSGPIERAKHFLPQIKNYHAFQYRQVKNGLLLMLWGFFEKLVISDRIALFVSAVYGQWQQFPGYMLILATILYAFQIYCDFSGYSDIATGAAQVLGFQVVNNFRQPYFSKSVAEFWRRWHISLSSWFRDYIYIPLGGNRRGKLIQYRNILIVFLISGLWHGASWNFIVWGGVHGIFQIAGNLSLPFRNKLKDIMKVKTNCFSYYLFQMTLTFVAVDFAWIFFRASGAKAAIHIIGKMLSPELSSFSIKEIINTGMDKANFCVMLFSLSVLLFVDVLRMNINIREFVEKQNLPFRWLLYYGVIFSILILGIYGPGYDASTFVYMQF